MKQPATPFATRLSGSAKETELRLRNIFQWEKKRPPVVLFLLTAIFMLGCFSLVSFQPRNELMPTGKDVMEVLEYSDSLIYAKETYQSAFDLYWAKEGKEPDLLCRFGHWGRPDVQFKKVQLGEQNYLLVQHVSRYPDVPFWVYKEFTNIFYLPEGSAPVYTLQIEGDFYFKDITDDGIEEIVRVEDGITYGCYTAVADGRLLEIDEYGKVIPDEIWDENLEYMLEGNHFTGVSRAASLVRQYEEVDLYIHEDSLSVFHAQ